MTWPAHHPLTFTLIIFSTAYAWLISETAPRYLIMLLACAALFLGRMLSIHEAVRIINWNTLLLLLGMFILVEILTSFGLFEKLAFSFARHLQGRPTLLFFALCVASGCFSMVINNITVMLFMTALTLRICQYVPLQPGPVILGEVCCANMIGAGTLIGAPPNLVMAGLLGYGFGRMAIHMLPLVTVITGVFMTIYFRVNRTELLSSKSGDVSTARVQPSGNLIRGWKRLGMFLNIDFETLVFFMGLFVLVGSLDKAGLFRIVALHLESVQNPIGLMLTAFWLSALASALIDNIPMAMAMAYLIKNLAIVSPQIPSGILAWAVLAGLTIGGNMTPIGASPNVVAYGQMAKNNLSVGWKSWMTLTWPATLGSMLAASVFLWIMYQTGWY